MEDRLKLPLSFSPAALRQDLDRLRSDAWIEHFVKQNYDGDWSAIALRMPASAVGMHPIASICAHGGDQDWVDAPLLANSPAFREVLAAFHCPLESVRLMRLAPGSDIKQHRDPDLAFEDGSVRLHVPVQTNPRVEFYLNDQQVVMAAGECWYLRLSDPHRVSNHGDCDRVHIVIDARVNSWLEELFRESGAFEG